MISEYWHLLIPVVLGALIVWSLRAARPATVLGVAAALLVVSGWLVQTLILDELPHLARDLNGTIDTAVWIGAPAILGVTLAVMGIRRIRGRRPQTA